MAGAGMASFPITVFVWAEFYCDRDYDRATGHVTVDDIFIDGKQREG